MLEAGDFVIVCRVQTASDYPEAPASFFVSGQFLALQFIALRLNYEIPVGRLFWRSPMSNATSTKCPLRILIGEDDVLLRSELRGALCHAGYAIAASVSDGTTALAAAMKTQPDVVILDANLSGIDGIEVARIMHSERIAPAMLLTANAGVDVVKRAAEVGVYSYLTRPFRAAGLIAAIEIARHEWNAKESLHKRILQLNNIEETRAAVTVAKRIMMQYCDYNEMEAYRYIQSRSMNTRKSMREVAEAILEKYQSDCAVGAQLQQAAVTREREVINI